jgi:hypothetical protein
MTPLFLTIAPLAFFWIFCPWMVVADPLSEQA